MSYKIDLHTHSYGSPDGGLKLAHYRYFLENKLLDYIAITDHNSIQAAVAIRDGLGELGSRIIIGEEITATEGEVIGLYLTSAVPAGLSVAETVESIRQQGGLVYVPHPFETVRSGLCDQALGSIIKNVDIIEIRNGRAVFQNRSSQAAAAAEQASVVGAASSDAHGRFGWGYTYSVIDAVPTRQNLVQQLRAASYSRRTVGAGVIYPKLNRLRRKLAGAGRAE